METGFEIVLIDEGLVSVNCFEIVLVDEEGMMSMNCFDVVLAVEEGMVNVNCFAFFSKDGPRRCHRSHVGLAFDLESLYVDLDCKSAFSHSDHLFSIFLYLLDHSPSLDFESDISWPYPNLFHRAFELCHCPCASGRSRNLKNMKDLSLSA